MRSIKTDKGFVVVVEPEYTVPHNEKRLIQESSATGDYRDALDRPGSSFLWIGGDHHLNREQVRELVRRMEHWLKTGRLKLDRKKEDRMRRHN